MRCGWTLPGITTKQPYCIFMAEVTRWGLLRRTQHLPAR